MRISVACTDAFAGKPRSYRFWADREFAVNVQVANPQSTDWAGREFAVNMQVANPRSMDWADREFAVNMQVANPRSTERGRTQNSRSTEIL